MASEFVEMFPAIYSERKMRFVVAAMHSQSYGPQHHDPAPQMVMVPDDVPHLAIAEWLKTADHGGVVARLLGKKEHGAVCNPPTQLVLFFINMLDRPKFVADFEIVE